MQSSSQTVTTNNQHSTSYRLDALLSPNQQCQSTEGKNLRCAHVMLYKHVLLSVCLSVCLSPPTTNTQLLTGWMPFCRPTNSVKALKEKIYGVHM